ncbi:hypothetical protein [Bradyrhizobium sp. CCBAU 11361]|uniref:hypothetical protein n=1 Tax=Bradyrhizobium sp. CCBAU 11361 TaxID=1630812 RepID=UPI002303D386|nr:hypothetical protein [Bradyrhizobium sp. CCBAU 11361]MDA9490411.1 hypothetical protein [Bradyrhizobium sp. CCBAU 11361]
MPRSTWHWRRRHPDARQIAPAPVESEAERDARQALARQQASERKRILAARLETIRSVAAARASRKAPTMVQAE